MLIILVPCTYVFTGPEQIYSIGFIAVINYMHNNGWAIDPRTTTENEFLHLQMFRGHSCPPGTKGYITD